MAKIAKRHASPFVEPPPKRPRKSSLPTSTNACSLIIPSLVCDLSGHDCPDPDFMPAELFPADLESSCEPPTSNESHQQPSVTPCSTIWHSSPTPLTDRRLIQNSFDDVGIEQPQSSKPLTFLHYDPLNPEIYKTEKRLRDQAELDQQREDAAALKLFGGSCLWCNRAKKKCEAVSSCKQCMSHQRTCYRNISIFLTETSLMNPDLPSQEVRQRLASMNYRVFQFSQQFDATINIRPGQGDITWTWVVTKCNTMWPNYSDCPIGTLVDMVVGSQAPSLLRFEHTNGTDPLVQTALKVAKLFTASQWLVQAKVFAQPADMTGGQLVVLYILVICIHRLYESSAGFCEELYYALRKPQPKPKDGLDPTWVATALYYRVACGMRELQSNLVIAKILSPCCQMDEVCKAIERILWDALPRRGITSKSAKKKILRDEIPKLQSNSDSSMEIWQNMRPCSFQLVSPIEMEYFLSEEFPQPYDIPQGATSNCSQLSMTFSQSNYTNGMAQFERNDVAGVLIENMIDYNRSLVLQEAPHVAGTLFENKDEPDILGFAQHTSFSNW